LRYFTSSSALETNRPACDNVSALVPRVSAATEEDPMPLLDHFHPPVHPRHHWESFHSNWATRLADVLNEKWLPPEFLAEEYTHTGTHLEIDVATYEQTSAHDDSSSNG